MRANVRHSFVLWYVTYSLMSLRIAFDPDDLFYEHTNESRRSENPSDDESDDTPRPWQNHPVHYVYDAAAERMKERLKEAQLKAPAVTGVVH